MSVISIRICRNSAISAKDTDDILIIKSGDGPNVVPVSYNDKDSVKIFNTLMNRSAVEDYLSTVMHVLSYDKEPFVYVQFAFPLFPVVMLRPSQFEDTTVRIQIYKMLNTTFNTWYGEETPARASSEAVTEAAKNFARNATAASDAARDLATAVEEEGWRDRNCYCDY